ncbi:MAG TPA: asparagine synthase-related protein [Ohtaekwangia sp.]
MSGFVGICSNILRESEDSVKAAAQVTVYAAHTLVKDLHADHNLILKKSFVRYLEHPRMSAQRDSLHAWIDGEVYNPEELTEGNESFADALLRHYAQGSHEAFLRNVNGMYIAVISDLQKQQLHIITDRYGLKPFYLYAKNNCLVFAPELKCFPFFKPFTMQIRKDAAACFIDIEHIMGTATWFEGVEATVPSMIYSYSWQTNVLTKRHYWSWSMIKRSSVSLDDAAEEMAGLLDHAIKVRSKSDGYRVGVALSGGFDSRALLAATRENHPPTYTFGIEDSVEVAIAKRVAALAGVHHTHFDMHVNHWLQKRFSGVWKTDGMLNMYHMHYSHVMDSIAQIMDVNLSGYLGDGLLGKTYLTKKGKVFLNQRINASIAQHYCGKHYVLCDPNDPFFDLDKIDIYLVYNRGRRMTGLGMEEPNKTTPQRLPFMDTKLLDFSYSLPDEYRWNSRVYHKALLLKYPEFYKDIPHATTRVPISPSLFHKGKKAYYRALWVLKFKLGIVNSYTDVYNWIKEPETATFIREILNPKTALYPNFLEADFTAAYLEPHLAGKGNYAKRVMSAVTMEVWLQQLLNKNFLNP